MKTILHIGIVCILLISCQKIFHPEITSLAEITTYEELLEACNGMYGQFVYTIHPKYGYGSFYWPNIKGDDITRTAAGYDVFYNAEYSCIPEESLGDPDEQYYISQSIYLWENFYDVIAAANNIISQFPEPFREDKEKAELLGEVYLMRAYCTFRLTRCFGRIPVITNTEVDFASPLPEYDEIYSQIENDLMLAIRLLPEKFSTARIPYQTPHQGSAKVMLAEVYLSWAGYPANKLEMYQKAAITAGNLIDSAWYYELALLPDFKDIWNQDAYLNTEVAYSVSFGDPAQIDDFDLANPYSVGYSSANWSAYYTAPDQVGLINGFYGCEINFYNRYPDSYRKDLTFPTNIYVPGTSSGGTIDTGYVHITNWNSCERPLYTKFLLDTKPVPAEQFERWWIAGDIYFGDPRFNIFRFAHTYLTYAEAKARLGEADASAYEAINIIRRRAHHVDLYTPSEFDLPTNLSVEAFADSIVWERAWEFAGEPEGRWFDLLRLDMVKKLPKLRNEYEGGLPEYPITEEDYFFPIPEGEIHLNPNLLN